MNQEIKQRWVSALRSGDYSQTKDKLKTEDGYCCLGVLCEIAASDGVVIQESMQDRYGEIFFSFGNEGEELPEEVADWAGLTGDDMTNPHVKVIYDPVGWNITSHREAQLSELNDEMDWDFDQIADVIERDL